MLKPDSGRTPRTRRSPRPRTRPTPSRRHPRHRAGSGRAASPGHPKRTRPDLPPDTIVELRPGACDRCSHALVGDDPAPLRHQVVELPPIRPVVTEYRRHRLQCTICGRVTCPALPADARGGYPCRPWRDGAPSPRNSSVRKTKTPGRFIDMERAGGSRTGMAAGRALLRLWSALSLPRLAFRRVRELNPHEADLLLSVSAFHAAAAISPGYSDRPIQWVRRRSELE